MAGLSQAHMNSLRAAVMNAVWGTTRKLRCKEIVLSLFVQGHLVDPPQYAAYHAFKLARNLLTKQPSLHESFVVAWRLVQENGSGAPGPVKELQAAARRMGWVWSDPWHFQRPSKRPLALLGGPDTWWLHEIRDGLRISQWKAAAARRQDMQGLDTDHGVDRLASMALIQQRKTAPRDKARLQSLLSGSLRLQEKLHVAKNRGLTSLPVLPRS